MNQPETQTFAAPPQEMPSFDYFGMLWRRKWLLLLGAMVGVGLGYLYYTKQPPVYQSSAELQITNPAAKKNMPVQGLEFQANPLADEIRVIRSELVLTKAAELGELTKLKSFAGLGKEQIAAVLSNSSALKIAPTNGKMAWGSTVVTVAYSCGDPKDARNVVQAVVEAYEEYLRSSQRDVGEETLAYIDDARGEVLEKLEALEKDYDIFKHGTPLISRDGTRKSVHREHADGLLEQKKELSGRRQLLFGQRKAILQAMESEESSPEAVLLMLRRALGEPVEDEEQVASETQPKGPTKVANLPVRPTIDNSIKPSEQMRQTQLFPLQVKERELLSSVGAGHPSVKSLRIKMQGMEQLIAQMAESEAMMEKAREEEMKEFEKALKAAMDEHNEKQEQAVTSTEQEDPAKRIQRQIDIRMITLEQDLATIDHQHAVIDEHYKIERDKARAEEKAEVRAQSYERDIARQRDLYERIVGRFEELNTFSEIDGRRVSRLKSPKMGYQVAPTMGRNLAMGCFFGLITAGLLGYLIEWSDKSYHSPDEIAEHLRMPVIGHIPAVRADLMKVSESESRLDPSLCTFFQPKSAFCEAYRAVRTALYFSNQKGVNKVIQVTSAVPSDGKSTITANLAVTTAQAGKSVLLIDCDFRRPRVHQLFQLNVSKGVAWMVENMREDGRGAEMMLGEAVHETEVPNLCVMPCGERPANPAELLSSQKFEKMLSLMREKFDLVLIDSPPLLAVTDPSNVAGRVDGVILVIRIRKVVRPMAVRAARMLETLGANVLGVVVNGVGSREAHGYGSKYYRSRSGSYDGSDYYRSGYGYSYGSSYGVGDDYEYESYYEEEPDPAQNQRTRQLVSNATSESSLIEASSVSPIERS